MASTVTIEQVKVAVEQAHARNEEIRKKQGGVVLKTPLHQALSFGDNMFMKLESEQVTNSFKVRGALNCIRAGVEKGVNGFATASTGNHGMAVAHVSKVMDVNGVIFLPSNVQATKLNALKRMARCGSVKIEMMGNDCLEAELAAMKYSSEVGAKYISPYNDIEVIAGQGTIGVEIEEQLSHRRYKASVGKKCLYVTVGGGGLIAGIAAYLKQVAGKEWRVVGCQPSKSAVMYHSIQAGHVVHCEDQETISDGSAGDIEQDAITFPLCKELVDEWILVSEEEICNAIRETFGQERKVIEGAAGTAVAGFLKDKEWRNENECDACVIVACGGNIDGKRLSSIITTETV